MRKIALTGSASGIGAALRAQLEAAGERVIGVDLRGAEIAADLSTRAGRDAAIKGIQAACDSRLDALVVCAGLGPQVKQHPTIVSVNYFGAAELLEALRPSLAAAGASAAVAVSSNSATIVPSADGRMAEACLAGNEEEARQLAAELDGSTVYAGAKLALARYVRRKAPRPEWAGAGIRLNAIAPGAAMTPLLQEGLDDPTFGEAIRGFPIPLGGFGSADQIAAAISFLLSPAASFCCGTVLYVDGGSDALIRGERY
jgi:NAD(P)-dependent dehydrogenase (short-subunit alcohol dehydrogenase family)